MASTTSSSDALSCSTAASSLTSSTTSSPLPSPPLLPRITIQYCTQCKWMLRAAYFAQELLSTFSTDLGELALQPATGGLFRVTIYSASSSVSSASFAPEDEATAPTHKLLWDRKTEGGFPEVKELKRRVRDVIDPERNLGHVDRHAAAPVAKAGKGTEGERKEEEKKIEDGARQVEKDAERDKDASREGREGDKTAEEPCEDCK